MQPPVAAYLRVYEPLSAFSDERADFWLEYARSGRAGSAQSGPARQRAQLFDAAGANWTRLPAPADEAYVVEADSGPLVCPWQLRARVAAGVRNLGDSVPAKLIDAFVPAPLATAAAYEPRGLDARGGADETPKWHEHIAVWHVPTRWFACVKIAEREMDLSNSAPMLRYRVPMARARRRARHAYGIVQTSLGRANPVAVSIREMSEWLAAFHPRSLVEVDYGGLTHTLPKSALRRDNSPSLVHEGLAALARGDVAAAGRQYEKLMRRWRGVRLHERSN